MTAARVDEEGWAHAAGEITLAGYSERFQSDLRYWTIPQYEKQWKEAVARLLGGKLSTALITSYCGPESGFHFAWTLWREGTVVFAQERMILTELLPAPFDPLQIDDLVGDRRTVTDEGAEISEWSMPFTQVATFGLEG